MKKIIFLFVFINVYQSIFSYEYIPFLDSYEIEEDEFEISFDSGLADKEWVLYEDAEFSEHAENESFTARLLIPENTDLQEDEDNPAIINPVLVLQLHGHWFETENNGKNFSYKSNSINKFLYHFIPISGLSADNTVLIKTNSSKYGSFTMYLTDMETYKKYPGKFAIYPFANEGFDFIVSVIIFVIGIVSLIFYLLSRNLKYTYILLFAVFSILLSIFHLLSTDIIPTFIPVIPSLKELIEMAAFDSLSLLLLLLYINIFEDSWLKYFKIMISGNIFILLLNITGNIAGYMLPSREIISFVYPGIEYLIIWFHMTLEVKDKYPANYFRFAFITIALTYLSQMEFIFGSVLPDIFFNSGLLVFYSFIALVPVTSYLRQDKRIKEQNIIFRKFVPEEFLSFLSKEDITLIKLGDQIEKNITVLFSDIRSFTAISEKMNPQEIFNYLNSYLERVGPVIRKHGGFIDKYIGDAVMALFPDKPQDAVDAAVEIQSEIKKHTQDYPDYPELKTGIGIHTGKTMLGIIGENERIESTVISDTVNTASRLEHLTKIYKVSVLLSKEVADSLPEAYNPVFHGKIGIRGKEKTIDIFSIKTSNEESI